MFGSSPRCRMKTRFGLSAKIPCPAPQVHFSLPGKLEIGFGQFGTTSYAPKMSCPPFSPGTAAKLGCCGDCPCRRLSVNTKATVAIIHKFLRMTFLLVLNGQEQTAALVLRRTPRRYR